MHTCFNLRYINNNQVVKLMNRDLSTYRCLREPRKPRDPKSTRTLGPWDRGSEGWMANTPWKIDGWNLQITHLERKIIFQTSMIMLHVNLQGSIWSAPFFCISASDLHPEFFHMQIPKKWCHIWSRRYLLQSPSFLLYQTIIFEGIPQFNFGIATFWYQNISKAHHFFWVSYSSNFQDVYFKI